MTLKDLPPDARPQERMLALGPAALSDSELVALILRTGTAGRSVVQMSWDLLQKFGGISGLLRAQTGELARAKGLGGSGAKCAQLSAVLELARRALDQQLKARHCFESPLAVRQYLQIELASLPHEAFAVMFLDVQNRLVATEHLFRGTLSHTSVYPREVVVRALHHHAASVVLAHNHPSGQVDPSAADISLTRQLKAALGLVDVRVLDHVVVAPGRSLSMAEEGML